MHRVWRNLPRVAPLLALAVSLYAAPLPLFALGPGPARDVVPLIEVDGRPTYTSDGSLLLTTVSVGRIGVYGGLVGWLDPLVEVVPEQQVIPPGQTDQEYEQVSRSQMDESKIAAAVNVLTRLTDYPDEHGKGALVQDVVDEAPATGRLFPGDVILRADGDPVEEVGDVAEAIRRAGTRRDVSLTVEAGGERREVSVRPVLHDEEDRPIIGVVLVESFPFDVTIRSGDIGGPSAGLMWALGLHEVLTPVDLAGGRTVAGTGSIDLRGRVHPIGGIDEKVVAAERAGADVFLVPRGNLVRARAVAEDVRLIPVGSVGEAIRSLEASRD